MDEPTDGGHSAAGHDHPVDPTRVAHARSRGLSAEDAGLLAGTLSLLAEDMVRAIGSR